jgi:hypothetical protein
MSKKSKPPHQINFEIARLDIGEHTLSIPEGFDASLKKGHKQNLMITESREVDKSLFSIFVSYEFFINGNVETPSFACVVTTVFYIQQFKAVVSEEDGIRPVPFHDYLLLLSLSHFRGAQAHILKGTPLETFLLPPLQRNQIYERIVKS